jgi:phosphomannomutase
MTLIKSISGIRGTIGGKPGDSFSPPDIVKYTSAYGEWIRMHSGNRRIKIVIGRDARISGEMVNRFVCSSLIALGIDIVDIGLATTPTVEIAVTELKADGGIIISASHNPKNWNALKLLNSGGEFISDKDGNDILKIADNENFSYAGVDDLGVLNNNNTLNRLHINKIVNLKTVNKGAICEAGFKVIIDCVNSVGGLIIPDLLYALGVKEVIKLYCDPTGEFPHNPEPLPQNLADISEAVTKYKADIGFAVDPDVDRLAIISEDGSMFGEEYTLVSVADYILKNRAGTSVSNLSSTRALRDITEKYGGVYHSSAVGEVNVVAAMKKYNAVIGGEGNGGIILPELHYGRDALVGIALFLSHLAASGKKCSELRAGYPNYYMSKKKIDLIPGMESDKIFEFLKNKYGAYELSDIDGLKIEFSNEWVHIRKSNTEPIMRIYSESKTSDDADKLAERIIGDIRKAMGHLTIG